MAALVSKHPDSSGNHALDDGIYGPQTGSQGDRRDEFWSNKIIEEGEDDSQIDDIASHITKPASSGSFIAVSRNRFTYLLDGEVGELKLIAVSIHHLPGPDFVLTHCSIMSSL